MMCGSLIMRMSSVAYHFREVILQIVLSRAGLSSFSSTILYSATPCRHTRVSITMQWASTLDEHIVLPLLFMLTSGN